MGTWFPASHWARCSARISAIRLFIAVPVQAQFLANPVQRTLVRFTYSIGGSSAHVGNFLPAAAFATQLDDPSFRFGQTFLNLAKYFLVCNDFTRALLPPSECRPNNRIALAPPPRDPVPGLIDALLFAH